MSNDSFSEELSSQIELSTNSVGDQAVRIEATATGMEEMNTTIIEVAKNAVSSAEITDTTREKLLVELKLLKNV